MTEPAPWDTQPPWKIRLLQQIQDLAAARTALYRRGYEPRPGSETTALRTWRTDLHRLADLRTDLEARAAATGVPRPWIDAVVADGNRGHRYTDHHPHPAGANPARDTVIDAIAADVWQLQHTAALVAARRDRLHTAGVLTEPEPAVSTNADRNMVWLWLRAVTAADALRLTETERDRLWATDAAGWRRIIAATVATYDDAALDARWRAHADPDIALHTALTAGDMDNPVPTGERGPIPPSPPHMIAAAERALADTDNPAMSPPDNTFTTGIEAVLPDPDAALGMHGPAAGSPLPSGRGPGSEVGP
ncbi:hypothetical protein BJY24_005770 [Nocardia transvalensis]|uniref:Uncharacterized protein n=1 Tax=Nocardia transvalensis TaxID=37333 RepID=A0A7W9PJG8_9NOCA|nr:hypothetical protein [Nocardia transvalensis]MBB5916858.1 hypothetical protein [Nocardia transvalensis]